MRLSLQPGTWTALIGLVSFGVGCSGAPSDVADSEVAEPNSQELSARPLARLILTDATLSRLKGRASAGAIPNVTILEVAGGHAPWLDQPERVGDAVSAFLQGHGGR